jgi:hypothetical protein
MILLIFKPLSLPHLPERAQPKVNLPLLKFLKTWPITEIGLVASAFQGQSRMIPTIGSSFDNPLIKILVSPEGAYSTGSNRGRVIPATRTGTQLDSQESQPYRITIL